MYIYNVTVNISEDSHTEWLQWMKEKHIPDVMKTGCFIDNSIFKVLFVEDEGHTYSIQYRFLEMEDYEKYQSKFAPTLQEDHKKKFGDKFVAFRSILKSED